MFGGAVLLVNTLRSDLGKAFILRARFFLDLLPAKQATGWARRKGADSNRGQDGWTRGQLTRRCRKKAVTADLAVPTFTENVNVGQPPGDSPAQQCGRERPRSCRSSPWPTEPKKPVRQDISVYNPCARRV
jgi:hypothetical protein